MHFRHLGFEVLILCLFTLLNRPCSKKIDASLRIDDGLSTWEWSAEELERWSRECCQKNESEDHITILQFFNTPSLQHSNIPVLRVGRHCHVYLITSLTVV